MKGKTKRRQAGAFGKLSTDHLRHRSQIHVEPARTNLLSTTVEIGTCVAYLMS